MASSYLLLDVCRGFKFMPSRLNAGCQCACNGGDRGVMILGTGQVLLSAWQEQNNHSIYDEPAHLAPATSPHANGRGLGEGVGGGGGGTWPGPITIRARPERNLCLRVGCCRAGHSIARIGAWAQVDLKKRNHATSA